MFFPPTRLLWEIQLFSAFPFIFEFWKIAFAGGEVRVRVSSVRRGWNRAPDGWWQRCLRGPRPLFEVRPRVQQFRLPGPPQPAHVGRARTECALEVGSIGSRRCGGKDGSRSHVGACQGRKESGTVKRFEELLKAMGGIWRVQRSSFRRTL